MKRVLVTGASGFIGRHSIPILLNKGYEVHALYCTETIEFDNGKYVHWHRCDLLENGQARKLVEEIKPTHILHFAWYTEHGQYWESIENVRWVQASLSLIVNFARCGGERAVLAGTCAEYDWNYGYLSEGVTPLKPQALYGVCKNSLQEIFSRFAKQAGISGAWGRIFFPYGPHEAMGRLVPSVITSLLKGQKAVCTHGMQIRDYIHVKDVASAFVCLLESGVEGPVNIASGEPISLRSIIYTIADLIGARGLVDLGAIPAPEHEPPLLVADVRKLNELVGWRPRITLEDGLGSTIDWWRDNI
jgi:nucleoside-diphosphate-sugar epimerase